MSGKPGNGKGNGNGNGNGSPNFPVFPSNFVVPAVQTVAPTTVEPIARSPVNVAAPSIIMPSVTSQASESSPSVTSSPNIERKINDLLQREAKKASATDNAAQIAKAEPVSQVLSEVHGNLNEPKVENDENDEKDVNEAPTTTVESIATPTTADSLLAMMNGEAARQGQLGVRQPQNQQRDQTQLQQQRQRQQQLRQQRQQAARNQAQTAKTTTTKTSGDTNTVQTKAPVADKPAETKPSAVPAPAPKPEPTPQQVAQQITQHQTQTQTEQQNPQKAPEQLSEQPSQPPIEHEAPKEPIQPPQIVAPPATSSPIPESQPAVINNVVSVPEPIATNTVGTAYEKSPANMRVDNIVPTTIGENKSASNTNTPAIVIGVLGGIVAFAIIIYGLVNYMKRRRNASLKNVPTKKNKDNMFLAEAGAVVAPTTTPAPKPAQQPQKPKTVFRFPIISLPPPIPRIPSVYRKPLPTVPAVAATTPAPVPAPSAQPVVVAPQTVIPVAPVINVTAPATEKSITVEPEPVILDTLPVLSEPVVEEKKEEQIAVVNEVEAKVEIEQNVEEMEVKRNSKFKSSVPSIISVISSI